MTQRAAVYLRVSKRDQTLANQVPDLERLLVARDFAIAATYQDEESGAKRRPELERLIKDAHRHTFDVVVIWALDRLGRTMHETVARVLELERLGVAVVSAKETFLSQTDPHVRALLVSVFAWVADWERRRLIERTNAGIARARAEGKQLGRPSVSLSPHAVRAMLELEHSPETIARHFGVGRSTLYRELARLRGLGAVPKGGPVRWGSKRRKSAARRSSP
jgi:DNA invertase Pin-like site-specific DNA recombinase